MPITEADYDLVLGGKKHCSDHEPAPERAYYRAYPISTNADGVYDGLAIDLDYSDLYELDPVNGMWIQIVYEHSLDVERIIQNSLRSDKCSIKLRVFIEGWTFEVDMETYSQTYSFVDPQNTTEVEGKIEFFVNGSEIYNKVNKHMSDVTFEI